MSAFLTMFPILLLLGMFLIWTYALVHAIRFEKDTNKIAWVIVIVIANIFGAMAYLLYRLFAPRSQT